MENVDTKNSNNVISLDDKRKKKELPKHHETSIRFWNGDKGRRIDFYEPCSCGCDFSGEPDLLEYLSGSNDDGEGFTIRVTEQETYKQLRKIFPTNENNISNFLLSIKEHQKWNK